MRTSAGRFAGVFTLVAVSLISACSEAEMRFEPGCIVFEGDVISIQGSRFEWAKFTDQRRLGDDGQPVDPFPGFPKTGTVDRDGNRLTLKSDFGDQEVDWIAVEYDDRLRLLTTSEYAALERGETLSACALTLAVDAN